MTTALDLYAAYWERERQAAIALGFPDRGPRWATRCVKPRSRQIMFDRELEATKTFELVSDLHDEFRELMDWKLHDRKAT